MKTMNELKFEVPENTYTLSNQEISLIHALCVYAPDGMTKKADAVRAKLQEQLSMHEAIGNPSVWIE